MHIFYRIWKHPLTVAFCNIVLMMFIYTCLRVFLYFIFPQMYAGVSTHHLMEMLLGGMRFDLTAILYLSSVYLLLALLPLPEYVRNSKAYDIVERVFYFVPNGVGIIANCMDIAYLPFSDRRTTMAVFKEFAHDNNILSVIFQGMGDYWFVTLFGIFMLVIMVVGYRRHTMPIALNRPVYYGVETAFLLVATYFIVIGIRGGFGRYTRPITISNAMQYVDHPSETTLVLNTPFTIMKSLENQQYTDPKYFPEKQLETIFTPIHRPTHLSLPGEGTSIPSPNNHHQPYNVVVLILESFATEHIGFYNTDLEGGTYKGFTPCLDSILADAVTFKYSYASGRKSIDAMPSVLSSIPMLIEPYIVSPYSTNAVSSIADILNKKGYTTAFFHGAPNGSMGFQAYARSAHFQRYYGMDEFNADPNTPSGAFDGTWAIWDEEFLQYYCNKMNEFQEPFCTAVFTASSHHPFKVPKQYEGRFPKGESPLCECIAYSDYALGRFFDEAARQPWFSNTLFVITADHTSQLYHEEYLTNEGLFRVPIAFYMPGKLHPRVDTTQVVSQTDVMPSVLALTAPEEPYFAFGEDVLTQPKKHNYAVSFLYPDFQIIANNGSLLFNGKKIVSTNGDLSEEEQAHMVRFLKAYSQQYISRLMNNRMTIETDTVCKTNE